MVKKREEKKKIYKNKIIEAANEIFLKNGYKNTTIEQISKKAGVGIGTTYLYFKSKSELYRVTIEDKLNIKYAQKFFDVIDYNEKPSIEISKISFNIMNVFFQLDKNILKDYVYSFITSNIDDQDLMYSTFLNFDDNIKIGYKIVLERYAQKGKFKSSFDIILCSDIIFNIILNSFFKYIFLNNADIDKISKEINEHIVYILNPYEK
ncbi:TetR/AcrR family transcriptional regulator [Maledivibacter halophilus]|uniref:Transcriptional regulator, TetR family n=1 Tax=Maledivibacter halophilus TaxID=36842 RepID=A0A1T5MJU9_9FIRM|nr:helix-turn-helix domain-containing protein [Maledivibacter halophilus]SKC88486.1 transcriptional regulator, TetR family [Maledivibacter halophilus]